MNLIAPVSAEGQTAEIVQPSNRAISHPAHLAPAAAMLPVASSKLWTNTKPLEDRARIFAVVCRIPVQRSGPLFGPTTLAADGRHLHPERKGQQKIIYDASSGLVSASKLTLTLQNTLASGGRQPADYKTKLVWQSSRCNSPNAGWSGKVPATVSLEKTRGLTAPARRFYATRGKTQLACILTADGRPAHLNLPVPIKPFRERWFDTIGTMRCTLETGCRNPVAYYLCPA